VHDTQGFFVNLLHHAWWKLESNEHTESGDLAAARHARRHHRRNQVSLRLGDRSIVAIHLKDATPSSRSWPRS
jgi:hypothetical protein